MVRLYLSSRTNSTIFTACCRVAVTDREDKCPKCREEIGAKSPDARWRVAYHAESIRHR